MKTATPFGTLKATDATKGVVYNPQNVAGRVTPCCYSGYDATRCSGAGFATCRVHSQCVAGRQPGRSFTLSAQPYESSSRRHVLGTPIALWQGREDL